MRTPVIITISERTYICTQSHISQLHIYKYIPIIYIYIYKYIPIMLAARATLTVRPSSVH